MALRSRRCAIAVLSALATAALIAQRPEGSVEGGFVIAGQIADPHGLRPKDAALLLGHQEGNSYSSTPVDVAADGSFRTARVATGTYVLNLVRDAFSPGAFGSVIGFAIVTVTASDVPAVRIEVHRDITVTGRFRMESENPRAEPPLQINVVTFLALDGLSMLDYAQPEAGPAGTFVMRNLFGPRVLRCGYRLAPDSPWWPSRVLLDGKDVTNVPTDFSQHADGQLEIVFTQHPARIAGIVTDANGRAVDEPWVMVTGLDAASWQPWATTSEVVRGNATGRYGIVMPPGEYRVNAVPGSTFASRTAARDGMSRIAFGGVTVTVKARETKRVDVALQAR